MSEKNFQLSRDPAYEDFLSAEVGQDDKGIDVTVLSMLARLGVDPWQEASELTALAETPAQKRLEALLESFTDVPTPDVERDTLAKALLAYLPSRVNAPKPSTRGPAVNSMQPTLTSPVFWIVAVILVIGSVAMLALGN